MRRGRLILIVVCPLLVGASCAPRPSLEIAPVNRTDRESALRKLDGFVGVWTVRGTVHGPGAQPATSFTGKNEVRWDGELLIARGTMTANGVDSTAIAMITFDPAADIYRTVSISPDGSVGIATARFDPGEPILRGRIESSGPRGAMIWEGSVRFSDPNTKVEHWIGRTIGNAQARIEIRKTELRER